MALVNTGVQLAKAGKKVLLVDFDLEAPGLTTFPLAGPLSPTKGIVEFVADYLESGISPDVESYCYKSVAFAGGGEVWIMPSGVDDNQYSNHFNSINWQELYEKHDGYLLFEDLRRQWAKRINADYVLVDSRTGHSDVEGICTRQLPDAVCFLFFPNDQNLEGLKRVTSSLRQENKIGRRGRTQIAMHFAVSNVPDLDDEDDILRHALTRFQEQLRYSSLAAKIHHYASLSLLNQEVFSLSRPKSRLTKEYTQLVQTIVRENLQDRDAAIYRLKQLREDPSEAATRVVSGKKLVQLLEQILANFPDPEVLVLGALAYESIGETQDALNVLTIATAEHSPAPGLAFAARARLLSRKGDSEGAIESLQRMLQSTGVDLSTLLDATSLISALSPDLFEQYGSSVAVRSLPAIEQWIVASQCEADGVQLQAQIDILKGILSRHDLGGSVDPQIVRSQLAVASIGAGVYSEAIDQLSKVMDSGNNANIADLFNLAMALWGNGNWSLAKQHLAEVVEIDRKASRADPGPNYLQCLAIANFAAGDVQTAQRLVEQARREMTVRPRREFSAWAYLRVDAEVFLAHLSAIEQLRLSETTAPEFVVRNSTPPSQPKLFH